MEESPRDVLLVRAGDRVCALSIADVVETMRPLRTAPLAGTPGFVMGAAIARGVPSPVVNLDALLGGPGGAVTRFVRLRCAGRSALLAVDAVLGVSRLVVREGDAPPLLAGAAGGAVEALGALDGALLLVLRAARLVPEEAFRAVAEGDGA